MVDAGPSAELQTLLFEPRWIDEASPPARGGVPGERWVLLCSAHEARAELEARWPGVRCVTLGTPDLPLAACYAQCAEQLLAHLQRIVREAAGEVLVQLVVSAQGEAEVLRGLGGMLKSAQHEHAKLVGQVLAIADGNAAQLGERLAAHAGAEASDVRYASGQRQVLRLCEVAAQAEVPPWRDGGVYLITGGTGGLGLIFARAIAQQVQRPTLVLAARGAPGAPQQGAMDELRALGARVECASLDVTDRAQVETLIAGIRAAHGELHGIVHSAGVLRDGLLVKKTAADLAAVLAPKVAGMVNLDLASQACALDCFVAFSSTSGALGNVGQADYAAGNAFMDAYASHRAARVASGLRRGATLSINWPLWAEGGMQVDEATRQRIWRGAGLAPLPTAAGVRALGRALALGGTQCVVAAGDAARIRQRLAPAPHAPVPPAASPSPGGATREPAVLRPQIEALLIDAVCSLLKLPREEIELDISLSEFGFDSITLTTFGNQLNERYGLALSPTIFFEHPTLESFAGYLLREQRDLLAPHLGGPGPDDPAPAPGAPTPTPAAPPPPALSRRRGARSAPVDKPAAQPAPVERPAHEPIAVIGISGSFAQSPDLHALWGNLVSERSCIGEIPEARWSQVVPAAARHAGLIDDMDRFDPVFFAISPREAEGMDPQQRLLMTYAWNVLEDAGYAPQDLAGSNTAVFVGTGNSGYGARRINLGAQVEGHSAAGVAASIGPNRVSYLLDLHGPSEPIETACSSALVAVHRALMTFRAGDCDLAIVGGINTLISPEAHLSFSKAGMLSVDGQCKTFSAHANGYVRSEGVGMLLLKRLSAAERDGDHIYGLLLGSAQNHGGRATSLTAPNPRAQAELIKAAMAQAQVEPRTVSYIEAHGTGTPLGDPVEVNGLKYAFREQAAAGGDPELAVGFCGLGSIKSNIGHAELAAGAAGLLKVLLQMKHRTLVKSLHSEDVNPQIELAGSPFYIVQETAPWPALRDAAGQPLPRRAGVSSFGFGGVNAHVIVEEYTAPPRPARGLPAGGAVLVVLSAKDEARLADRARRLLGAIARHDVASDDLRDLAYTLQVGRDAMEARAAFVVGTLTALTAQLEAFVAGRRDVEASHVGRQQRGPSGRRAAGAAAELPPGAEHGAPAALGELAALWVAGATVDWRKLHAADRPRRLSLPSYPFANERYWVAQGAPIGAPALHPLVHRNTSELSVVRYSTQLTGQEYFLADHVVKGEQVLPGVAHLEMARAAAALALGLDDEACLELGHVVFVRPVVVAAARELHISLAAQGDGSIAFEIFSEAGSGAVVHSKGSARRVEPGAGGKRELTALQAACTRVAGADECYAQLRELGLAYGAAMRGLVEVRGGRDAHGPVALGRLALPDGAARGAARFVLSPSLLDASLQASIGLLLDGAADRRTALPFAIERVVVRRRIPAGAWAVVRPSAASTASVRKLDIVVCDDDGAPCVELHGYASRVMDAAPDAGVTTLLVQPSWTRQDVVAGAAPSYERRVVVTCGLDAVAGLAEALPDVRCVAGASAGPIDAVYAACAARVLDEAKALLQERTRGAALLQVVVPARGALAVLAGLSALLRTAQLENPRLVGQLTSVAAGADARRLAALLDANARAGDARVREDEAGRAVAGWREWQGSDAARPWRDEGVYLITGGTGGLGLIVARAIAQQVARPTLVLAARSAPSAAQRTALQGLVALGARVELPQVDVTDRAQVEALIAQIQRECGGLHGIVHSAGVLRDGFVIKKTAAELASVLAPKVAGLVNLDEASRDCALECFLTFSSTSGALGNVGQADYAAANAFMDAYASYRNAEVARGARRGRTLSVNWPLWADGGMQVDAATRARLRQALGVVALESARGLAALDRAWASGLPHVMVLEGEASALCRILQPPVVPTAVAMPAPSRGATARDDAFYRDCVEKVARLELSERQFLDLFVN